MLSGTASMPARKISTLKAPAKKLSEMIADSHGAELAGMVADQMVYSTLRGDSDQQRLVDALNDDGRIYITQGAFDGRKVIRFQVGQFDTTREDVMMACEVIADVWRKIA